MTRTAFRRGLAAFACALAAISGVAQAEWSAPRPARLPAEADGRVIVKFKDDGRARIASAGGQPLGPAQATEQALQQRAGALGVRAGLALRMGAAIDGSTQVVTAQGMTSAALAARLAADAEVVYAVPDQRRQRFAVPNDPLYGPSAPPVNGPASGQWYLKPPAGAKLVTGDEVLSSIDAQTAWDHVPDLATRSASVVVAVLDTGVRAEHPDLAGKVLPGYDMVADVAVANDGNGRDADASDPGDWITSADKATTTFKDCDVADSSWHGTIVSGIIGAATNNAIGMAGTGWNVKVLPVRVLGKCFGYDSDIIAGMRWAAGLSVPGLPLNPNPAKVLNLSLGGDGACNAAYIEAVNAVTATGSVIVAAAGNTTGKAVNNPANCPGVIGVAAVRHIGTKVGFSDVGPEISIAAPGGNCVNVAAGTPCLYPILSTSNAGATTPAGSIYTDSYDISVGTSFSAPLVAGTAALMLAANPALAPAQVRSIMMDTARVFPFRGAPADPDSGAIQTCHAPSTAEQLQCYCTTSTCGAGMLDASWAVYAAANSAPRALITSGTPVANQVLTLSSVTSVPASGRTIVSQEWTLIDSTVGSFVGGASTATGPAVSFTPSAAGKFSVRLVVTDSAGVVGVREQTFDVAATPPPPPPPTDSGGGAVSALWLAALAAAVLALGATRRRA